MSRHRPLRTAALAVAIAIGVVPLTAAPAFAAPPTVNSGSAAVPGVQPGSRAQGSTTTPVTINGTNLVSGSSVDFGSSITVSGTATANAAGTTLTGLSVAVAGTAATGPRVVTVTSPDQSVGSCSPSCFTVTAAPTISTITPAAGNPGQTVNVTIKGTGFQTGATVTAGNGITVSNVARPDDTTITANFTIANNASNGARDVRVTNPDGSFAQRDNAFSVGNAISVTSLAPNTRGRGAQNQAVTITGIGFVTGATVSFSGSGVTVDSATVVSSTRIDVVIDIAAGATVGARTVTVTNPNGISDTCPGCFNVAANPTVTSTTPSSVARGRQDIDVVVTGSGFLAGATASFGPDITVSSVTVTSATSLTARITVGVGAATGARDVRVTNTDGGTDTCNGCFTVAAGRALVLELIDTKGTATTNDDAVITRPISGATYSVRVTAKQSNAGSPTDTTYIGTPVLTSTDSTFVAGTCPAATAGVSLCTGVRFGDLGTTTLTARGTGATNGDRTGTLALVTQPTGLELTSAPTSGEVGQALTYVVRPTVGISGAKIDGYGATRTLRVTGGGSSIADGATLACGNNATCTFTLTFSTAGTKTVRVEDNGTPSRSTPTVTVTIEPAVVRGTYTPLVPARVLDTRQGNDGDGIATAIGGNTSVEVQLTGRGGVPADGVAAVVVNVTAVKPTASGFLALYPAGGARPVNTSTINFRPGQVVANLAAVKIGVGGKLAVYNLSGATHVVLDVVGWYSATPAQTGGRTVAVVPSRILDTRAGDGDDVSTKVGPNSSITRQVLGAGGVPASGVSAVVVNVTAVNPTASTYVTAYPSDASLPTASTLNLDPAFRFGASRTGPVPNLAIVKLGADGKIALYNRSGTVDLILDVVGFVSSTSQTTQGRFVSLAPSRVLDTRVDNDGDGVSSAIGADRAIDVTFAGRGGVPASGVEAVLLNVTAVDPTASGFLTVYPTGTARPTASSVNFVSTQIVPNLVLVKLGTNGQAGIYNLSGATHVAADVVGYYTT